LTYDIYDLLLDGLINCSTKFCESTLHTTFAPEEGEI